MKPQSVFSILLAWMLVLASTGAAFASGGLFTPDAVGTAFTYQGHLRQSGELVAGACDMQFSLYDALSAGSQVGSTLTQGNVAVADGLFTVSLDFGGGAFAGSPRWLEIAVRCPAGSGEYAALTPRQALTSAPYALFAGGAPWDGLSGVPAGFADGVDNDTAYTAGNGLILDGLVFSLDEAFVGTLISETITNNPQWFSTVIISNTNLLSQTFQLTIEGACPEGSSIRQVNPDGSVACEADDNTTYTAGDGLALTGTEFSVDYVQVITEILPTIITTTHPANLVVVAQAGGDFTSIQAAIDSITDAAADNPYTVFVAPGRYMESVTMQPYISLLGASQASTILSAPGCAAPCGTVTAAANAELASLTIENTGGAGTAALGIYVPPGANTLIHDLTVQAQNGEQSSNALIYIDGASPVIYDVTLAAANNGPTHGILIVSDSAPSITRASILLTGSATTTCGICLTGSESSWISDVHIDIQMAGGGNPTGVNLVGAATALTIYNTEITISGGNIATGVYAGNSDLNLSSVAILVSGASTNYGIRGLSSGPAQTIQVDHCVVNAATNTYSGDVEYTALIGGSKLLGGPVNKNGGTATCAGVYDEAYVFYSSGCP